VETFGPINERTSARYTATLTDETGAAIDGTALDAATLTFYDQATGTVINSRSAQNVKNTNGVTISAAGELVWTLVPADNAILGTDAMETHIALFLFTWGGAGVKACPHQVGIRVRNLAKHPAV
jgi:hypothetical protein